MARTPGTCKELLDEFERAKPGKAYVMLRKRFPHFKKDKQWAATTKSTLTSARNQCGIGRVDGTGPYSTGTGAQRQLALRNAKGDAINAKKRSSPHKARTNAATHQPLRRASIKAGRDEKSAENKRVWEAKNITFMAAQNDAFKRVQGAHMHAGSAQHMGGGNAGGSRWQPAAWHEHERLCGNRCAALPHAQILPALPPRAHTDALPAGQGGAAGGGDSGRAPPQVGGTSINEVMDDWSAGGSGSATFAIYFGTTEAT